MARLGQLEREVMNCLWDAHGPQTVRDVLDTLPDRALAYTTVMTVLDRLERKDMVGREKDGRAFRYSPIRARDELTASLMREALADAGGDRTSALVHFAENVSEDEAAALRAALERVTRYARKTPPG